MLSGAIKRGELLYLQSIYMRSFTKLLLLLVVFAAAVAQPANADPVLITSVSTIADSNTSPMSGSLAGGTSLYIHGMGFDPMFDNNVVYVGSVRCVTTSKGVTPNIIMCYTGAYVSGPTNNLPITIAVIGKQPYTCSTSGCLFTYSTIQTPALRGVYPKATSANLWLNFYGVHRIVNLGSGDGRDMGDVTGLYIGSILCNRFDIVQSNIPSTSSAYISCSVCPTQEGGYYQVTEWVTPGYAQKAASMLTRSVQNNSQNYEFILNPTISDLSAHEGGSSGNRLTITGTGFSPNAGNNLVTVAGIPCKVVSSKSSQIVCDVGPDFVGNTYGNLSTTATSQVNGFLSGTGLNYARYDLTKSLSYEVSYVKELIGTPNEEIYQFAHDNQLTPQIAGDLLSTTLINYDVPTLEAYSGYFLAPTSGNYTFRALADDRLFVYLANDTGSVQTFDYYDEQLPFLQTRQVTSQTENFFILPTATMAKSVLLSAGEAYYMEVYHVNTGGPGSFRISAEVPNTDVTAPNQVYEVQHLNIAADVVPEVIIFTTAGADEGTYAMSVTITDPKTLAVTYHQLSGFSPDLKCPGFANTLLAGFIQFKPYNVSCVRQNFDYNGNPTDPYTNVYTRKYIVSIPWLRSDYHRSSLFNFALNVTAATNSVNKSTVPTFTVEHIQDHSVGISGTFGLTLGGVPLAYLGANNTVSTSIPYNVTASQLQSWISTSYGYPGVTVDAYGGPPENGQEFFINFKGVKGDVPPFVGDSTNLSGGKIGTAPTITTTTLREGSSNLLMDPITTEFLATDATSPQVIVKVNGATSQCLGDCSYTINPALTPVLTAASLSGNILTMTVTTSQPAPYSVVFNNQVCTFLSGTAASFTCSLPTNTDGSPVIEAGSYLPSVYINTQGYAAYAPGLALINYNLAATSLSQNDGSSTGGETVTLTGLGFPLGLDRVFNVVQCGKNATVKATSNTKLTFTTVPCASGVSDVTINFNSQTATLPFTYNANAGTPTITGITPKSYSPMEKGFMNITGSGFGSDTSLFSVWLTQDHVNIFQLNVIEVSDTNLFVRIPGGVPGDFKVQVSMTGFGSLLYDPVDSNDFTYGTFITSVTPTSGSIFGGTVLTIIGENFSPTVLSNQAYVGKAGCSVLTASTTMITCRTSSIAQNETSLTLDVVVTPRVMFDSICKGSCSFTYQNVTYPTLTPPAITNNKAGDAVALIGTDLINGGVNPRVFVGTVEATVTFANATNVNFTYPSLPNGTYAVNVYVDGIGYGTPYYSTNLLLPSSLVSASGSYVGGSIYIKGNALTDVTNPYLTFKATSNASAFYYQVRTDNTASLFGIDYSGCSNGATIVLSYIYNNVNTNFTYSCVTSKTPNIILQNTTALTYTGSPMTLRFNRTNYPASVPDYLAAYPVDANGNRIDKDIVLTFGANFSAEFTVVATLTAGRYSFKFFYNSMGKALVTNFLEIVSPATYTISTVDSGFQGGAQITVSGTGLSTFSSLSIAGVPAKLNTAASTSSQLVFNAPPLVYALSQTTFGLVNPGVLNGTYFADTPSAGKNAFDNLFSTKYTSSNAACFVGLDFGAGQVASVSGIRYYPDPTWKSALPYIGGATLSGSNDGTAWTDLFVVDNTVHTGWNMWKPATPSSDTYRYVAFRHNSTSSCNLAEFQVSGRLYVPGTFTNVTAVERSATFTDGYHNQSQTAAVTYKQSLSPNVASITPRFGSPAGGYDITMAGSGFGTISGAVTVSIDGISCVVKTVTNTQIVCTAGARPTMPKTFSFNVAVNNNLATLTGDTFVYAYRWSDPATWGGDIPPIDGDSVYVPTGMVLLVDQSTPKLYSIIVEGWIVFSDELPVMLVQTNMLIVEYGVFQAGTEKSPYVNNLTFVLTGDYYDKQLPGFGNKVIGCHSCTFDLHGKPRNVTWTELIQTVNVGDLNLTLTTPVDWKVGEVIVVVATSYNHTEAEQKVITAIDASKTTITVDTAFAYQHLSVAETFGTDSISIKAEVGLLTRNILITGDGYSRNKQYGAHVMMHGASANGLISRIEYTEITQCGQPSIVGRYCIHFHMTGDMSNSYVRGNAVHHSFARVLTIHASYYLLVEYNVGYWVQGHNIFLEDGIEQYNVIQYNLMISSLTVFNMLQTDISVASYWITNPLNTVRYNRAAGSDFYGFWYEIKSHPDGPSATSDICPTGLPLGESHDNIAHSNIRFGLRIFQLYSSQNPCLPIRRNDQIDPWALNPSIQNTFFNYLVYKNGEDGLLAEQVGNTIFQNITAVDNGHAGIEFYLTNFTKEPVVAKDCVIIGKTQNNGMDDSQFVGTYGIITARTDGSRYDNIRLYNFPPLSILIGVGSKNDLMNVRSTGGKSYFFRNISKTNITGRLIQWIYTRRYIIYDEDGSLTGTAFDGAARTSAAISPYYPHNNIPGKCNKANNQTLWGNSMICNSNVAINNLLFGSGQPTAMFFGAAMYVYRLDNDTQNLSLTINAAAASKTWVFKVDKEQSNTWSFPFVSGYTYNVWWNSGIDFTSIAWSPSYYMNDTQDGFVIRVNYTTDRELFDIGHIVTNKLQVPLITASTKPLNYSTCKMGDYYHDVNNRYLFVCISGKNKSTYEYLSINGIACRYLCPKPGGGFTKEKFVRMWSNITQWPGGVLPAEGDNVTVNGNWTLLLDIDVLNLQNLTIDGDIYLTDNNRQLSANFIWIRYGSLNAGNSSSPFQYNFTLTLNGGKFDKTYTVDPTISVSKYMVVTGTLNLFGIVPATVTTKLSSGAQPGDTTISVLTTNGWAVGQKIGIAPSFSKVKEYEEVTITSLTSNTVTFTPALSFAHYGSSSALTNGYGTLDMRASVGVLDRNIKILGNSDPNGWGFGVVIYAWKDTSDFWNSGNGVVQGVQFQNGGQTDTLNAAFNVINTVVGTTKMLLTGNSFEGCGAYCMYFSHANNLTVTNNYVFMGQKFLVYAEFMYLYSFTGNVLVGAQSRPSTYGSFVPDDISCYSQYTTIDWSSDANTIQDNICQGSEGEGFTLPFMPCSLLGTGKGFINNVAGSCIIGFLITATDPMVCGSAEKLKAYACEAGIVSNSKLQSLTWDGLMLADNIRGIGLRFGGYDATNNSLVWTNSWISAVSRPTCAYCYGDTTTICSNTHGVRLLAVTANTERLPKIFGDETQTICKNEMLDANAWLYGITFDSFMQTYTGAVATKCSRNVMFEVHPIDDSNVANHHFFNTTVINSDTSALGYYAPPLQRNFGWFGGCGNLLCTGRNNYLMIDHDGGLLGFQGLIIPNNSAIGDNTPNCTYNPSINGHICKRSDFARLKYRSISADFQTRIMWPVNLTADGSNFTTVTNGWREWTWEGHEPMNTRKGQFLSIMQLNKIYNMSFAAQPPSDMLFSFSLTQFAGGNKNNYVGIKLYYPLPNAISVTMSDGTPTTSILATDTDSITNHTTQCGANQYFYKNNTIHFIVTTEANCTVRVSLTSSVQVSARLSLDINKFYENNGVANFIDVMCTFLNITTNRIKIVGVYSGSTVVDFVIVPPPAATQNSSTVLPNSEAIVSDLKNLSLLVAGASNSNIPNLLGVTTTVNIMTVSGQAVVDPSTSSVDTKMIIIGVVVGVAAAILIGISIFLIVKKFRKRDPIIPDESSAQEHSKDVIRHDNKSSFELKEIEMIHPEEISRRVHPQ